MSEIIYVDLIFENNDFISFEAKNIFVTLSDVCDFIISSKGSISKNKLCKYFSMIVGKEENKPNCAFGIKCEKFEETNFQRIMKYNDIVAINLYYKNKTLEQYILCWDTDNDLEKEINIHQKTSIKDNGDLVIEIKENIYGIT